MHNLGTHNILHIHVCSENCHKNKEENLKLYFKYRSRPHPTYIILNVPCASVCLTV